MSFSFFLLVHILQMAVFGGTQLSAHFRMREKDSETGSDAKSEPQCSNYV